MNSTLPFGNGRGKWTVYYAMNIAKENKKKAKLKDPKQNKTARR